MVKRKALLTINLFLLLVVISCGSETRVQDDTDEEYLRTVAAQTVRAEIAATDTPVPEPTAEPTKQPGTRDNPVPLGQPLDLVKDNDTYFRVTILEVIRGDAAWRMIYQANMFNEPPGEGKEYVLAKVRVEFISTTIPDKTLAINSWNFGTTSKNQIFEESFIINPEPELNVELFPGGAGEGYYSNIVYKDDPSAMIHFTEMFSDQKFFFALN